MKEWLLAKSNIRKAKGLTVGLILLITLAACFFNIVLITFTDYNSNTQKVADRLNAEDANIMIKGNISNVDEAHLKSIINEDVLDYEITRQFGAVISTPYGDGTVAPVVTFAKGKDAFNCKIGKNEIMEEDTSIKDNYIYLPYTYHTGGKLNVGDDYELKVLDKTYNLKIKGFINNMVYGSHNAGTIQVVASDDVYEEMADTSLENIIIKFDLKDDVNSIKFINKFADEVSKEYPTVETEVSTLETAISSRTFISVVLGVSFLVMSVIIIVIVMLMLSNNISNYIKENMRILGAIKALGYTNKNIKLSFIIQFLLISGIGCVLGVAVSYVLGPMVTNMMTAQSGIPYTMKFNIVSTIITVIFSIVVVILTVFFFLRKTSKIEPITALREGISTHNFKKNRISLDKTKLPLNVGLALKTTFTNIKQNIATFVITFFLVFMGIISLALYQNFAVSPKLSLLTFEIFSGAVMTDSDMDKEVYDYIESLDGVHNTRLVTSEKLNIDDARLMVYVVDDANNLNNKDVCYKGRLPQYDNEVALSGKLCKNYNYNIGDEVVLTKGNQSVKYLLTGFIQTANNNGQEAVLLSSGAEKILGTECNKMYYFDVDEGVNTAETIKKIEDYFGDRILSIVNFDEVAEGSSSVFKMIAGAMVILVLIISALVIFLVLYLLIKTLINNKKKDYGILKALGYESKDVMRQNAISFMPTIILSVVISCIASSFLVNPYLGIIMRMFGIMKLTFDIPVNLVIIMGIGFVVVSYLIAIFLSRKIKKIEPYKLITEE